MRTSIAFLFADIFLYSYEADFHYSKLQFFIPTCQGFHKIDKMHRYIDNVMNLDNSDISNYLLPIYPDE